MASVGPRIERTELVSIYSRCLSIQELLEIHLPAKKHARKPGVPALNGVPTFMTKPVDSVHSVVGLASALPNPSRLSSVTSLNSLFWIHSC